jgi:hypothetical protein
LTRLREHFPSPEESFSVLQNLLCHPINLDRMPRLRRTE